MEDLTSTMFSASGTSNFIIDSLLDVVNSNDGLTTLREAVIGANSMSGQDTITFDLANDSTINLNGQLDILDDLRLSGLGAGNLTISGSSAFNSLFIDSANVEIDGLIFTDAQDSISVGSGVTEQY